MLKRKRTMNTQDKYALADLVIAHALKNGAQQVSVSKDFF